MKTNKYTLPLLCLLLFSCIKMYAQPYKSIFGQNSTGWVFTWTNLTGNVRDSAFVEKDTMVGAIHYKKINTLYAPATHYPGGLLREDTVAGKVWYKGLYSTVYNDPFDSTEHVLFDYNLQVGDTIEIRSYGGSSNLGTVSNIQFINGAKYIFFSAGIVVGGEPVSFIEGIGGNCGIMKLETTPMGTRYLLCSYKDGVRTDYTNIRYQGACNPSLGIDEKISMEKDISVYPNPAKDILYLKSNSNKKLSSATLLSIDGHIILERRGPDLQSLSIKGIPDGYYFLKLYDAEATPYFQKIIIQNN